MRNGQNKRMRGRNRKGGHHHHQNSLSRMYDSNGPDVKIRGTASHVAEKYLQLARDAQSSGDPIAAENYYQHAEHYFRLIAAAQEQFRQSQPITNSSRPARCARPMTVTTTAMVSNPMSAVSRSPRASRSRTIRASNITISSTAAATASAAISAAVAAFGFKPIGKPRRRRPLAIVHHRRSAAASAASARQQRAAGAKRPERL